MQLFNRLYFEDFDEATRLKIISVLNEPPPLPPASEPVDAIRSVVSTISVGEHDADLPPSIDIQRWISEGIVRIPDLQFADGLHRVNVHANHAHVGIWEIEAVRGSLALARRPREPQLVSTACAPEDRVS